MAMLYQWHIFVIVIIQNRYFISVIILKERRPVKQDSKPYNGKNTIVYDKNIVF